jgi:hypothetical protein
MIWWAVGKVTFEPKRQGGACAYEHKAPRVQARPNLHGPCTRSPGTTHVPVKLKTVRLCFCDHVCTGTKSKVVRLGASIYKRT